MDLEDLDTVRVQVMSVARKELCQGHKPTITAPVVLEGLRLHRTLIDIVDRAVAVDELRFDDGLPFEGGRDHQKTGFFASIPSEADRLLIKRQDLVEHDQTARVNRIGPS